MKHAWLLWLACRHPWLIIYHLYKAFKGKAIRNRQVAVTGVSTLPCIFMKHMHFYEAHAHRFYEAHAHPFYEAHAALDLMHCPDQQQKRRPHFFYLLHLEYGPVLPVHNNAGHTIDLPLD